MEGSKSTHSSHVEPTKVESQVKPLTQSGGINDPEIKLENLEPGLVWGVRQGVISKDDLPDNVAALIDPSDG